MRQQQERKTREMHITEKKKLREMDINGLKVINKDSYTYTD